MSLVLRIVMLVVLAIEIQLTHVDVQRYGACVVEHHAFVNATAFCEYDNLNGASVDAFHGLIVALHLAIAVVVIWIFVSAVGVWAGSKFKDEKRASLQLSSISETDGVSLVVVNASVATPQDLQGSSVDGKFERGGGAAFAYPVAVATPVRVAQPASFV